MTPHEVPARRARRLLPALLALAAVTVVAGPAAADRHEGGTGWVGNAYFYSTENGQCLPDRIRDPITVQFVGTGATTRNLAGYERGSYFRGDVDGDITFHMHWRRHNSDNVYRQAWNPDNCTTNPGDTDLASASGFGNSRWHTRMWQRFHNTPGSPNMVMLTPHREDWTDNGTCGEVNLEFWSPNVGSHAVERGAVDRGQRFYERHGSGFDRGRRLFHYFYSRTRVHRHGLAYSELGNTRSMRQCDGEFAGSNGTMLYVGIGRGQCLAGQLETDCRRP